LGSLFGSRPKSVTFSKNEYYPYLADLFQAISKVSPSEDSREPSLQTLATLIQDDEFYSTILYVNQAFSHNDNPDEMITAALPAIQSHPIFFHLGLAYRDGAKREEYQRQMDAAVVTYELFSVVSLGFETAGSEKWYQGKFMPFVFACTQADRENTRDMIYYHHHAAWRMPPGTPLFTVELLQNLCPNNPFVTVESFHRGWEFNAEEAKELLAKFRAYPNFRNTLMAIYRQNGMEDQTIEVMFEGLKADPHSNLAKQLANDCLERGDYEKAIEAFTIFAESPEAAKNIWVRADFMMKIGDVLFEYGKIEEAAPYYHDAASSQAQWGLLRYAHYLELVGQQEEAEKTMQQCMQAYPVFEPLCLWGVCYRGDSPNLPGAEKRALDYFSNGRRYHPLIYLSYCAGERHEEFFGKNVFIDCFLLEDNPLTGLLAYFEKLQNGEKEKAGILLKLLRHQKHLLRDTDIRFLTDNTFQSLSDFEFTDKEPYQVLAAMIELDQRSEKPGSLNPDEIEYLLSRVYKHVLEPGRIAWLVYAIGRYYEVCGEDEKAVDCYLRVISMRANFDLFPRTMSLKQLKARGLTHEEYLEMIKEDPNLPRQKPSTRTADILVRQLFRNYSDNPLETPLAGRRQNDDSSVTLGTPQPLLLGHYRTTKIVFQGSEIPENETVVWWRIPENGGWSISGTAFAGQLKTGIGQRREDGAYPITFGENEPLSGLVSFYQDGQVMLTISLVPGEEPQAMIPPVTSNSVRIVLQRELK